MQGCTTWTVQVGGLLSGGGANGGESYLHKVEAHRNGNCTTMMTAECISHSPWFRGALMSSESSGTKKPPVGRAPPPAQRGRHWVQTERSAHEKWAMLISKSPVAARLMHVLVALMDQGNAVVASQATLGKLLRDPNTGVAVHRNTIRKAIQALEQDRWIEIVAIGGKGGALAYVVNDRVAWGARREGLRYSRFSAQVIASSHEQLDGDKLDQRPPLRQVPTLMWNEDQIPSGPGADPPAQALLDGIEPDLPARDEPSLLDELFTQQKRMVRSEGVDIDTFYKPTKGEPK